jgi:hypothetical protein
LLFVVRNEFVLLKSCFLDLVIAQSPYIFGFLPEFADFLAVCRPSSPFENSEDYQYRLMLFGSLLRNGSFSDSFYRFLAQELRMLENALSRMIAQFFPEFLTTETKAPQSSMCEVAIITKDPCRVQANVMNELMVISFTSGKYETLVWYPFWEILPFWLCITGPSLIGPPGESVSFCERVSEGIMRIVNRSRRLCTRDGPGCDVVPVVDVPARGLPPAADHRALLGPPAVRMEPQWPFILIGGSVSCSVLYMEALGDIFEWMLKIVGAVAFGCDLPPDIRRLMDLCAVYQSSGQNHFWGSRSTPIPWSTTWRSYNSCVWQETSQSYHFYFRLEE